MIVLPILLPFFHVAFGNFLSSSDGQNVMKPKIFYYRMENTWLPLIDDFPINSELCVGQHRLELLYLDSSKWSAFFRRRHRLVLHLKIGRALKPLVAINERSWYQRQTRAKSQSTSFTETLRGPKAKAFADQEKLQVPPKRVLQHISMLFSLKEPSDSAKLVLHVQQGRFQILHFPKSFNSLPFAIGDGEFRLLNGFLSSRCAFGRFGRQVQPCGGF
jgi:hypothetical protein